MTSSIRRAALYWSRLPSSEDTTEWRPQESLGGSAPAHYLFQGRGRWMGRIERSVAAMIAALTLSGPAPAAAPAASAPTFAAAEHAFTQGDWRRAAGIAEALGTAPGDALAARALLAGIGPNPDSRIALDDLARAEALARAAVAFDPELADAHLQLVVALGLKSRIHGDLAALIGGFAAEARTHIDAALDVAPDDPWAHALDGLWHLELVARGGALARASYGASIEDGLSAFARARRLSDGAPAIVTAYAIAILAVDRRRFRDDAQAALGAALAARPATALDRLAQARAEPLAAALERNDEAALVALLTELGAVQPELGSRD